MQNNLNTKFARNFRKVFSLIFLKIFQNKLVNQIAISDNDTVSLTPFTCVRNKDSCHQQQCCFGQVACCKSTGVCGCKDVGDSPNSCPFDIATTSISSSASSSERSVVTNACIQTISRKPAVQKRGPASKPRSARNIAGQPVINYSVTPGGHLNGFVRTSATGNAYVLTTTTTADFGPVKQFLAEFSAKELLQYLEDDVIEDLLMISGCRRWQIFRK